MLHEVMTLIRRLHSDVAEELEYLLELVRQVLEGVQAEGGRQLHWRGAIILDDEARTALARLRLGVRSEEGVARGLCATEGPRLRGFFFLFLLLFFLRGRQLRLALLSA